MELDSNRIGDSHTKPGQNKGMLVDMHTHSRNSHDSECPVADMAKAQAERGMAAFAVTDHCDILDYPEKDVLDCIKESVAEAGREDGKVIRVLKGIELGDGIWHPKLAEEAMKLADYDVVIGSVHTVLYKGYTRKDAYSRVDFSRMPMEDVYNYLTMYFEDILKMLKLFHCDIMAHLTCPLRYITGKYGIEVDITRFDKQVDEILEYIIGHGIAMEINTSTWISYRFTMPDERILKRFVELGGYLVTLGSDAHVAANAASGFAEAVAMLKSNGISNIFYFEKRTPIACAIE